MGKLKDKEILDIEDHDESLVFERSIMHFNEKKEALEFVEELKLQFLHIPLESDRIKRYEKELNFDSTTRRLTYRLNENTDIYVSLVIRNKGDIK